MSGARAAHDAGSVALNPRARRVEDKQLRRRPTGGTARRARLNAVARRIDYLASRGVARALRRTRVELRGEVARLGHGLQTSVVLADVGGVPSATRDALTQERHDARRLLIIAKRAGDDLVWQVATPHLAPQRSGGRIAGRGVHDCIPAPRAIK